MLDKISNFLKNFKNLEPHQYVELGAMLSSLFGLACIFLGSDEDMPGVDLSVVENDAGDIIVVPSDEVSVENEE